VAEGTARRRVRAAAGGAALLAAGIGIGYALDDLGEGQG